MKSTFLSFSILRVGRPVLAAWVCLGLTGCSFLPAPKSDPTRHYVLTGVGMSSSAAAPRAEGAVVVGLRTVRVAPYLDGKAMIVRRGENEISYRDLARWAEPLSVGVGRMLATRLGESERVARVLPQPYPFDVVRDVDVALSLVRAEAHQQADGRSVVSLVAELLIVRSHEGAGSGEVLWRETFVAPEVPWVEGDYAGLASALSEAVDALATRVVAVLPTE